jgi:hypothetical protein
MFVFLLLSVCVAQESHTYRTYTGHGNHATEYTQGASYYAPNSTCATPAIGPCDLYSPSSEATTGDPSPLDTVYPHGFLSRVDLPAVYRTIDKEIPYGPPLVDHTLNSGAVRDPPHSHTVTTQLMQETDDAGRSVANELFVYFGQVLGHDFGRSPIQTGVQYAPVEGYNTLNPAGPPTIDIILVPFPSASVNASGAPQQPSTASSYLDLNTIYGTSPLVADLLRSYNGGRLLASDQTEFTHQFSSVYWPQQCQCTHADGSPYRALLPDHSNFLEVKQSAHQGFTPEPFDASYFLTRNLTLANGKAVPTGCYSRNSFEDPVARSSIGLGSKGRGAYGCPLYYDEVLGSGAPGVWSPPQTKIVSLPYPPFFQIQEFPSLEIDVACTVDPARYEFAEDGEQASTRTAANDRPFAASRVPVSGEWLPTIPEVRAAVAARQGGYMIPVVRAEAAANQDEYMTADQKTALRKFVLDQTYPTADDTKSHVSGDTRVGENIGATLVHLLFFREHNRLAGSLATEHPTMDDEELFQEARRRNIAQYQQVAYEEWFALAMGKDFYNDHVGKYDGYDPDEDATTSSLFLTAAMRFPHSMVTTEIAARDPATHARVVDTRAQAKSGVYGLGVPSGKVGAVVHASVSGTQIGGVNNNLETLARVGGEDRMMTGLLDEAGHLVDNQASATLTSFTTSTAKIQGYVIADVEGMIIRRGRMHGLADYHTVRVAMGGASVYGTTNEAGSCGQEVTAEQDEATGLGGNDDLACFYAFCGSLEVATTTQQLYRRANRVDVYVGLLLESGKGTVPGGLVGPTTAAILAAQLVRTRAGDRFWYENPDSPHPFSAAEVQQIQETSLADLVERHFPGITSVRKDAFLADPREPMVATEDGTCVSNCPDKDDQSDNEDTVGDGNE